MSTLTLYPSADKTDGAWGPNDGSDIYACIDEASGGSDFTSLLKTAGDLNSTFLVACQDHSSETGIITKITILANAKIGLSMGSPTFKFYITVKSGSTQQDSSTRSITSTATNFTYELTTNPATGSAWTWSEIDSLLIGCHGIIAGGSIGQINVYRMNVTVEYTAAASGNPFYAYAQQ